MLGRTWKLACSFGASKAGVSELAPLVGAELSGASSVAMEEHVDDDALAPLALPHEPADGPEHSEAANSARGSESRVVPKFVNLRLTDGSDTSSWLGCRALCRLTGDTCARGWRIWWSVCSLSHRVFFSCLVMFDFALISDTRCSVWCHF